MRPTVDALARHFHVVAFSLLGERGTGGAPQTFDSYLAQLDAALAFAGCERAMVCGVSLGGLIALRYAAARPERVERLVLVSTPSPSWRPNSRMSRYASAPRSSALAYVAGAPGRLGREIAAAIPGRRERLATAAGYLGSILCNPTSPRRMAARVRCLEGVDFAADARRVLAPTLVVTGESELDRVVPVEGTREVPAADPRLGWCYARPDGTHRGDHAPGRVRRHSLPVEQRVGPGSLPERVTV